LLMLVEALIGKAGIEAVYERALAGKFRFFSFGDTSLLTRKGA
jgi:S-adenosylmethionine:tRNA ribosyltransferase-isomerase